MEGDSRSSRAKTILAIDDEQMNLKLIGNMLEPEGFRVIAARTAEEGLELMRAHRAHLILMDVKLPGIDGLQATRILRADPEFAHVPIIAVSAYAMPEDIEKAREAGVSSYLTKPFGRQDLLRAVREFLDV